MVQNQSSAVQNMKNHCPYGRVGDILPVREPVYVQPGIWRERKDVQPFHYATDVNDPSEVEDYILLDPREMPEWAGRARVQITKIRIEKIQDISDDDVEAEGFVRDGMGHFAPIDDDVCWTSAQSAFRMAWNDIYGNWEENPDVWVIEFQILSSPHT